MPAFDQGVDVPWKISLEDHQRDELLEGMRVEDQAHASKARTIAIAGKVIIHALRQIYRYHTDW